MVLKPVVFTTRVVNTTGVVFALLSCRPLQTILFFSSVYSNTPSSEGWDRPAQVRSYVMVLDSCFSFELFALAFLADLLVSLFVTYGSF